MSHEDKLIKEYETANENIRFAANICLAQETIFIAVNGALLTEFFKLDIHSAPSAAFILELIGGASSVCFLIIMWSSRYILFHCTKRAAVLEERLDFKLWRTMFDGPEDPITNENLLSIFRFPLFTKKYQSGPFRVRPHLWIDLFLGFVILIIWVTVFFWAARFNFCR